MSASYRVIACNTATDSENRIHDDAVARRIGFAGGLVPGVDTYAYMTQLPVARWGRAWLERGAMEVRFTAPVYDGAEVEVRGAEAAEGLALSVHCRGAEAATGRAWLAADVAAAPLDARAHALPPAAAVRPAASETSLAVGTPLSIHPLLADAAFAAGYLADVREGLALYREAGLLHPGLILRSCNWALLQNVVLGPWIHVGSTVRHHAAAAVGSVLRVAAGVVVNDIRRGHRFVELEALVFADEKAVASVRHVAIWLPRQLA